MSNAAKRSAAPTPIRPDDLYGIDPDRLYATLTAAWPVERPRDQRQSLDIEACIALGWLYREDASNGWTRIGLTDAGRAKADELDAAWARAEFARLDARPPKRMRRHVSMTCNACGADFVADSTDLWPEGCPACHAVQS
jgi:hypothetical protein